MSRLASGPLRPEGRNDTPSPGCPTAPRSFAQAVLARSDEGRIRGREWRGITFLFLLPQRGGRWRRRRRKGAATPTGGRGRPLHHAYAWSPSPAMRARTSRGHARAEMTAWWSGARRCQQTSILMVRCERTVHNHRLMVSSSNHGPRARCKPSWFDRLTMRATRAFTRHDTGNELNNFLMVRCERSEPRTTRSVQPRVLRGSLRSDLRVVADGPQAPPHGELVEPWPHPLCPAPVVRQAHHEGNESVLAGMTLGMSSTTSSW